jgi:hypothetical protein
MIDRFSHSVPPSVVACNTMYSPEFYIIGIGFVPLVLLIVLILLRKRFKRKSVYYVLFFSLLFLFLSYALEINDRGCEFHGNFAWLPMFWNSIWWFKIF